MMRKTREIARLRTRTAFNSEALGPDDAMAVEMQVGELAVARRMLQPHRIDGPAGPGTDFGHLVLEAIWQADLCPDFRTVDRAADGLAIHFHVIGYAQPTLPPFDVDLELDRQKRSEERSVGKSVSVRVDPGGRRIIKKKKNKIKKK